jgi:hypothetical protein
VKRGPQLTYLRSPSEERTPLLVAASNAGISHVYLLNLVELKMDHNTFYNTGAAS